MEDHPHQAGEEELHAEDDQAVVEAALGQAGRPPGGLAVLVLVLVLVPVKIRLM